MTFDFVILAAGLGTRMKSSTPKFFQTVAGKPIIKWIIDTCKTQNPQNIIAVTQECLSNHEFFQHTKTVIQQAPKGTADAVFQAIPHIDSDYTFILCGDMPLIESHHLELLRNDSSDIALIAATLPTDLEHMPYGRVIIKNDSFEKIVEYKEATEAEKSSRLINTGVYKIKTSILQEHISKINQNNSSGEYYLTDLFEILKNVGHTISVIQTEEYWPFHGINTMKDLAKAEQIMQKRLREKFLANGVKLLDPETTYFSFDTEIAQDVVIEQNVVIGKGVRVKSRSRINAFSHISDCEIMENVEIGPFARIRGNCKFEEDSSIGNFVEVKGSSIGKNTKAKHLSYIGDATIGANSNIGAGTITCNYDGVNKHKTAIGNDVFVGSNTTLVAPVELEDNTIIGAGSVITKKVTKNSLAISRSKQTELPEGATRFWKSKKKI